MDMASRMYRSCTYRMHSESYMTIGTRLGRSIDGGGLDFDIVTRKDSTYERRPPRGFATAPNLASLTSSTSGGHPRRP